MKKILLILLLAFSLPSWTSAQFAFSQGNQDGCCIEYEMSVFQDQNFDLWTIPIEGVVYSSANTTQIGNKFIWTHCYSGDGVYEIEHCSPLWSSCSYYEEIITNCEPPLICWTNQVNCPGPGNQPLGTYTVCCDGRLTMSSTAIATYVKIYNHSECVAPQVPEAPDACILCGLWQGPNCDDDGTVDGMGPGRTWFFGPGTVTASNSLSIEFQSNSPWHEWDCDWEPGTDLINLSNEFIENCDIIDGGGEGRSDHLTNQAKTSMEVEIFPNPATDQINIKSNSEGNLQVSIFNLDGKELLSKNIQGNNSRIDLTTLSPGFYLVNVKDVKSELEYSEKIIIQE